MITQPSAVRAEIERSDGSPGSSGSLSEIATLPDHCSERLRAVRIEARSSSFWNVPPKPNDGRKVRP